MLCSGLFCHCTDVLSVSIAVKGLFDVTHGTSVTEVCYVNQAFDCIKAQSIV